MRLKYLTVFAAAFLAALLCATVRGDSDSDARAALALAQAQQPKKVQAAPAPVLGSVPLTYGIASQTAAAVAKPLVTFIGVKSRPVAGAIVCQTVALDGYDPPCIVVSVPARDWLDWRATLPATATDADIAAAIRGERKVSQAAVPFDVPPQQAADDELPAAVAAWIDGWNLGHFERYRPARNTQRIATTNGAPSITPMSRRSLERKYQVPGGTEHAVGVRSDLFKWASSRRWTTRLPVLNSFGYFQHEVGWTREYDVGSTFMDVLSHNGRIFAVRVAEKQADGAWRRFTDYRDRKAEPPGYVHVRPAQCNECHRDANTGGYATAMVSGGDQIFSDPYPELE